MINYGQVKSSIRPPEVEMTSDKVFVASNIEEYNETIEDRNISGYKYNYISYTKDEYILLLSQNKIDVEALQEELKAAKILLGVE